MLHWTPRFPVKRTRTPAIVPPAPLGHTCRTRSARSDHALMLAHAAKRRRAAVAEDRGYWLACAPAALAKAASIRGAADFARLP